MDSTELNLNIECRDGGGGSVDGGGSTSKLGGDGFIDRSKVRILLCDNNASSSEEVLTLLMGCSYQVTSVRSARQVIDALNAEGPDIDLILAEVDIPMSKGMKMLKYITRHKDLRRIPVIMMSAQDEVSTVVKCLRLGAADYLVKPLRTNELLNLWTHMWRRRHMLGLVEKNILCYEFGLVVSDPSDVNTTSTTLFSDDTDDRSRRIADPDIGLSTHQEDETASLKQVPNCHPDVPGISDRRTGQFSVGPKKSELRMGESSAFFTYVKSSIMRNNSLPTSHNGSSISQSPRTKEETQATVEETVVAYDTAVVPENGEAWEKSSQGDEFPSSSSLPDSLSLERSCTPPGSIDYLQQRNNFVGEKMQSQMPHVLGLPPQNTFPYYMPGVMNQVMMPPSAQIYQQNLHDFQSHAASVTLPQYNHLPHCVPQISGMPSFPYYPLGMCLQPNQVAAGSAPPWPSCGNSLIRETKTNNVNRREAALMKFRQKRKERCFDKKIRYVNRKKLAERRPRVRGQFVRKVNGVNVDLNGHPACADDEDDDDEAEYEEDLASQGYSVEDDASAY